MSRGKRNSFDSNKKASFFGSETRCNCYGSRSNYKRKMESNESFLCQ